MREVPEAESLTCIFREGTANYLNRDVYYDASALSNTEGGSIYIGVAPDGSVTGVSEEAEDPGALCGRISRHTVPPISLTGELLDGEKRVIQLTIPKSAEGLTASSDGRVLRRRLTAGGALENVPIYPCDVPLRLIPGISPDYTATVLQTATTADFDPLHIERLRWILETNSHDASLQGLSNAELFKSLGFVRHVDGADRPTVTGLLLIGRFEALQRYVPTAVSKITVTKGTTVHMDEEYLMPIPAVLERITYSVHIENPVHEMRVGLYRRKVPDFDEDAVAEAALNAFIHRDYTMEGFVGVRIFDEGIAVTNPGALPEGLEACNLLTAQPHCINPSLARAVRRLGLKGTAKRGMDTIFEGALAYGSQLPEYYSPSPNTLGLFFPRTQPNKDVIGLLAKYRSDFERPLSIEALLVVNALNETPRSRVHEIAEVTKLPQGVVRACIGHLIQRGVVRVRDGVSGRVYSLTSYVPGADQRMEEVVRPDPRADGREAVLDLASEKEFISNADVAHLLQISSNQAYRVLKDLAKNGFLEPVNKGRYSKYRLKAKASEAKALPGAPQD